MLTAIALELAHSSWTDELDVTLVGLCPELPEALADRTGRLRYVPDLSELIVDLEQRANDTALTLTRAGLDSPRAARLDQVASDAWTAEIVVLAQPVHVRLRARLDQVLPGVGLAAVTAPGLRWAPGRCGYRLTARRCSTRSGCT